ncbi:hypothetical protein RAS_01770 [Rickettsia asiatica]|uniref:Uncharacterized protein n=1 Tax=Rickettsia asiatica TaxID=238800 RepID=A0A510G6B2_9RICK|nr:hypothetical protein [Rickettsia asiatica]BBJ31068.1 hypothetical protein RAS_01770 [Rickettsia asiatica]
MPSKTTYLKVKNNTASNITTAVRNIDNYDWGSKNRPDHNFNNKVIKPSRELIMPEDINTYATANLYTLDLIFDDHTKISCRIDQGIAAGRKEQFIDYIPATILGACVAVTPPAIVGGVVASTYIGDAIYSNIQHSERGIMGSGDHANHAASISVMGDTVVVDVT